MARCTASDLAEGPDRPGRDADHGRIARPVGTSRCGRRAPSPPACARPAPSSWASATCTSSRSARPGRSRRTVRRAIRTRRTTSRAVRAAAPRFRSLPAWRSPRSVLTQAAPFVFRLPPVDWWDSSRRTGGEPGWGRAARAVTRPRGADRPLGGRRGHPPSGAVRRPGGLALPAAQRGARLGVPRGYFREAIDPAVRAVFAGCMARLESDGCRVEDVDIPHAAGTPDVYRRTQLPEAAAYHRETLDAHPDDYGEQVRRRLESGRLIAAEEYVRAQQERRLLTAEVDAALDGRAALLLPTLPIVPPRSGSDAGNGPRAHAAVDPVVRPDGSSRHFRAVRHSGRATGGCAADRPPRPDSGSPGPGGGTGIGLTRLAACGKTLAAFDRRCIPPELRCSSVTYWEYAPSSRLVPAGRGIDTGGSRCDAGFATGC